MLRHKFWTAAGAFVLVGLLSSALPDTSVKTPTSQAVQAEPTASLEVPSASTSSSSAAVTPAPTGPPVANRGSGAAALVGGARPARRKGAQPSAHPRKFARNLNQRKGLHAWPHQSATQCNHCYT